MTATKKQLKNTRKHGPLTDRPRKAAEERKTAEPGGQSRQKGKRNAMKDIKDYIPKQKQKAIKEAWKDEDGYWIKIKKGWYVKNYFAEHTIHEDTIAEIKKVAKQIRREEQ